MNKRNADIPNSAKKARRNGNVPGVLYGKKINNLLFEVGELELYQETTATPAPQRGVLSKDLQNGHNFWLTISTFAYKIIDGKLGICHH